MEDSKINERKIYARINKIGSNGGKRLMLKIARDCMKEGNLL